jgi:hypothetical protein
VNRTLVKSLILRVAALRQELSECLASPKAGIREVASRCVADSLADAERQLAEALG